MKSHFDVETATLTAFQQEPRYNSMGSSTDSEDEDYSEYDNGFIKFKLLQASERENIKRSYSWILESKDSNDSNPLLSIKGTHLVEIEGQKGKTRFRESLRDFSSSSVDVKISKNDESILCVGDIGYFVSISADFPDLGTVELEIAVPKSGHVFTSRAAFRPVTEDVHLSWIRLLGCQVEFAGESGETKPSNLQLFHSLLARRRFWLVVVALSFGIWIYVLLTASAQSKITKALFGVIGVFLALKLFHIFQAWWYTGPRSFLFNGWNAWSFTGTVLQGQKPQRWALPDSYVKAFHQGTECTRGFDGKKLCFASELYGVLADRFKQQAVVAGFLSQREQYGAIGVDRAFQTLSFNCACDNVCVKAGDEIKTDWVLINLLPSLSDDPLQVYLEAAARNTGALNGKNVRVPVGWCSWYDFFEKVTEADLVENLAKLDQVKEELPLTLFQIDDGYQEAWGDWTTLAPEKFHPSSIPKLIDAIKKSGFTPGIWLAPYSADKDSKIAENKPEWIIRKTEEGKPSNSANCGKWFYGFDATNPEVNEYVRSTLSTVTKEWGFSYVKLDFLYSAVLKGCQTGKKMTRAQAMQLAFKTIRSAIGDEVFFLGCGTPLGSALGWVNANRVSSDAGLSWDPELPLPFWDKWNLPSAKNMMRSTIVRMPMHGRWWINDPDCLILRDATQFTTTELISMATVKALSGGSLLLSDDMQSVSKARLSIAKRLLPVTNMAATPLDLLDRETPEELRLRLSNCLGTWHLLALCNWERSSRTKKMYGWHLQPLLKDISQDPNDEATLFIFDFWSTSFATYQISLSDYLKPPSKAIGSYKIPKHGSMLFCVRILKDTQMPMYIGSDLHFSCGLEVVSFDHSFQGVGSSLHLQQLRIKFDVERTVELAYIWVYLPFCKNNPPTPSGCAISKLPPSPEDFHGVWKVAISLAGPAAVSNANELQLEWNVALAE